MTITALSSLGTNFGISRDVLELRSQFNDLQRQLATGQRSQTYGGLGVDRLPVMALRTQLSSIESYQGTIDIAQIRLDAVQQHLDRMREISAETRSETLPGDFQLVDGSRTQAQLSASEHLNEVLALLNFELGGRYFFAGRSSDAAPVVDAALLLDGDGIRAGLKQVVDERRQADLGAAGLGRVTLTNGGPSIALAEDGAGHPFGFKLSAVETTLTGTTVTGPTGAPATVDVSFSATLPQAGELFRATLDLPDGTQAKLELTATATAPAGDGEFLIGADETATAANFEAALSASLQSLAQRDLAAASAQAAATNFFEYDAASEPQRVDGPPFDSATALRDATAADTVYWYKGDRGPGSARDSAVAKIDDSLSVSYGTRADEDPLRALVSSLALLAGETFSDANPHDEERYRGLTSRVAQDLNFQASSSIEDLIGELGFKQRTMQQASERHDASRDLSLDLLQQKEGVDDYEISARLLSIQTTLQASYETTSLLSGLSLVNFLR